MAPALDAPVVDLQLPAGLAALGAHPAPAAQSDRHKHTLADERDIHHAGAGSAQQTLKCGGDPHVALLDEPLAVRQPAASRGGGGGSRAFRATSANFRAQ